jgi:phosphatidate cytidylyltransferase
MSSAGRRPPPRQRPPPARRSQPRRRPRGEQRARAPRRRGGGSELAARVIVAIPALIFAVIIVAVGGIWFALALAALAILALGELFDLYRDVEPVRLAGFLGIVGVIGAAYAGTELHVLLALVALFPVLFAITLLQRRAGTLGMAITVFGVVWIGVALAHGVLLRDLAHGDGIIIDILVGTFVGDSGAYLGGRWFGRHRLAPGVSPNKTWEGLGIGIFTAILATYLAGAYQEWLSPGDALLLGLGIAIAAPIGDLFESFVKREAGTKDTGAFFGAHGGVLDRLDAVLFSAVVGYYIWLALL